MKYLCTNPVTAVAIMFGAVLSVLLIWIAYRTDIQDALRSAQDIIMPHV